MRIRIFFVLAGMIICFCSCEDSTRNDSVDCNNYDYSDCDTKEPETGRLHITLSINQENPLVPITIYTGKHEENNVFLKDTVAEEKYDTMLPVGNFYTVTAKYKKGNSTVIAVDGDNISKKNTVTCDSACWTVKNGEVNLKLK